MPHEHYTSMNRGDRKIGLENEGETMALHAFTQCWVHLVWATKRHAQIADRDARWDISRYLQRQARSKEIYMLINYANADHVHALVDLPTRRSVADVARLLKGASSRWITKHDIIEGDFSWACGYGAFSVSPSNVERVAGYIAHQGAHHQRTSFQSEYTTLVKKLRHAIHAKNNLRNPTIHRGAVMPSISVKQYDT